MNSMCVTMTDSSNDTSSHCIEEPHQNRKQRQLYVNNDAPVATDKFPDYDDQDSSLQNIGRHERITPLLLHFLQECNHENIRQDWPSNALIIFIKRNYNWDWVNSDDVKDTWQEFQELDEEAKEEGKELAGDMAKKTAENLLNLLCDKFPEYYSVYPDSYKGVVIHFSGRKDHSVMFVCRDDGRVSCYLSRDDTDNSIHYSSLMKQLPEIFLAFIDDALSY